jgi:hypothetical protein
MEKIWKEVVVIEFTIISYQIPGLTEENKEYSLSSLSITWSRYDNEYLRNRRQDC